MAGVALERKGKSFAARQRVQSTATMPDGTGESGERRMNDTQRQNYRGNEAVFAWHDEARPPEVRERAAGFEVEKQEIAPWFSREAAAVWAACGAFEWIALGYLGLSSALIATFAENLAHPAKLIENYRGNEAVFAWHDEARPPEVRERAAGFEVEKQEIAPWFSREAAAVWAACGAFEWIALGYLGLSSALIATFAENLAHPAKLI